MSSSLSLVRRPFNPISSKLRILAIILILYLLWMYSASRFMFGDWATGVFWTGGPAGALFPIPMYPGILEILVMANPIDSFLFLVLFQSGLWIFVEIALTLFALSPYTIAMSSDS